MAGVLTDVTQDDVTDAILKGLRQGNPNMVRVVEEIREKDTALEVLKNLQIEITPFTIPDDSIYNIVLRAPEYIIEEVQAALLERRRLAEFGGEALDA
jgi:hypothetical protein